MGFLDLSTNVSSKKHVDFSDARYQLSDKVKQSENKNVRATFTLYDSKETKKTAVQDISAAYALSDKKLPIGELLNKMVDLIIDMEDGVLDTEKDAVYAWKYSMTLLEILEDKSRRHEQLAAFDNSLKASVINSDTFMERYPGKYIIRTNFFDQKVKEDLMADIIETFKEISLPRIHESAIKKSREIAEAHENPVLDRIVEWAMENYQCEVDSFFQVKQEERTGLCYSINTVIIHLRNGYDMSIVGCVGTDYDDKFAVSVLDTQKIKIQKHGERISQKELQQTLENASNNAPINPLANLLKMEKRKNAVLKEQYDILSAVRPMVSAEALELQAAESVVGKDYIWGCKTFRETHEDLPIDFKFEDIVLPEYVETEEEARQKEEHKDLVYGMEGLAETVEFVKEVEAATVSSSVKAMVDDVEESNNVDLGDLSKLLKPAKKVEEKEDRTIPRKRPTPAVNENAVVEKKAEVEKQPVAKEQPVAPKQKTAEDVVAEMTPVASLFDEIDNATKKKEEKPEPVFGSKEREKNLQASTVLPRQQFAKKPEPKKEEKEAQFKSTGFNMSSTLLPGVIPKKPKEEPKGPSVTSKAKPVPTMESTALFKDAPKPAQAPAPVQKMEEPVFDGPEISLDSLDNLDDLFA